MTENEKPVNTHWLVGVAGMDEEVLVYAAYVQHQPAISGTVQTFSGGTPVGPVMAVFKNAEHKIVFEAQAVAVTYVRRADVTGKVDRNADPGQLASLKTELREAGGGPVG